ncbi:MAG: hypothetical protein ACTHMQ_13480 [Protaetiibacter sp.]
MSTTDISAVIAPGPLLPAGDAHARRYREFHVKPASVIDGGRMVDVHGLGGMGYRVQLGLTFAGTALGTPADRILETLESFRLVIELIAADRLTIGWEGPRWHVRYAEGVAFDGACRVGEPVAAGDRRGDDLEIRHSEGRDVISWADVADFAAFVNRGLELDRSILLLAGSRRGPALDFGSGRPELRHVGSVDYGAGETVWAEADDVGRVEAHLEKGPVS